MKAATRALGLWLALALSPVAQAIDFGFEAPADAGDAAAGEAMRDLAARVLPVYQDDDPGRYLSNLSALQLVAGNYDAAQATRQALRERRQQAPDRPASTDARAALLDLYAQARALEADDPQVTLGQAFDRTFGDTVAKLGDADAYDITSWPGARPDALQEDLQQAFDRARGREQVTQAEALRLVWTYLAVDLWRSIGVGLEALAAEDDDRRYVVEDDVPIKTPSGATLQARVVRPKNVGGRLPALLELSFPATVDDAKASAAHGYAGIVVQPRGKTISSRDGADARAVIAWIARQRWSDGRVGMFGRDDSATATWAAATRRPRALKAIATECVPVPGGDTPGKPLALLTIPVLAVTGYGEADVGALHYFRKHTQHNQRADHTLLLGAYDAGALLDPSTAMSNGNPVDPAAVLDLVELRHQWFDHVFKRARLPVVLQGRVNYEAAGAHEWRHADSLQAMAAAGR